MTCAARLHGDPTGLACTGADDHEFGCTFESTSGMAHHRHEDDGGES
jgi:hypothetical protein